MSVDNWRWAGVPFYLRTGKRLRKKKSEVVIEFKQPPLALFRQASMAPPEPNQLVISIQPEETIKLRLSAKVPGTGRDDQLRWTCGSITGTISASNTQTGYETLLYDAMTGDRSLFKRADIVEAGWAHRRSDSPGMGRRPLSAGTLPGRLPGPGGGRRDAGARRPPVEAAVRLRR